MPILFYRLTWDRGTILFDSRDELDRFVYKNLDTYKNYDLDIKVVGY